MRQSMPIRDTVPGMDGDAGHKAVRPRGSRAPRSSATPGRTALVTGGASGIGLGIAEALLDQGLNVAVADVRDDHLARAQALLEHHEHRLMALRLDVTDKEAWVQAVDVIDDRFGAVDILCLNAGIGVLGTILDSRPADWDWLMGVNLEGVTNGLETVLPLMRARGAGGHVVATSSAGGLMVASDGGIYSSAKFGVIAAMDCLRAELAPEGIGVTTLCPAGVNTNIHDHETMRPEAYQDSGLRGDSAQLVQQQQAAREMLSKGADPREVGQRVLDAIDENAAIVFTDGGIAPIVEMRRDALIRAARRVQPSSGPDERKRIVLIQPAGEAGLGRSFAALGLEVDELDIALVDAARAEPELLTDPLIGGPLVVAIAPQKGGGSASVDWVSQVHRVLRRCYTVIRGLVPDRVATDGGGIAVVLSLSALRADSGKCADSVLGRSLVGLTEGLRAELLAAGTKVSLVFVGEDEDRDVVAERVRDALRDGPLHSLGASADECIKDAFGPWLDELARTPSDLALPPLGPMGEVYR